MFPLLFLLLGLSSSTAAQSGPTVPLSYGTFQGSSSQGIDSFLGIPFAQAQRFGLPQAPANVSGVQPATAYGAACPQRIRDFLNTSSVPGPSTFANLQGGATALTTSEDCLFVNVIRPSNAKPGDNLPVLFWIYGGAFEFGDTSANDGSTVVARSIALGQPVIYVSANHRMNAFGFLASKEVKQAGVGNLGLHDQQFALQWIQRNIVLFGGGPTNVTIWGQSSGAISVALQMVTNGGDPAGLFRGAVMQSGSPIPTSDILAGQQYYDQLVSTTGCSSSLDTLTCLKAVPFEELQTAVNNIPAVESFTSLRLPWQPRVDGIFLTENAQDSVTRGAYAKVPLISGDCDDEGTLFSLSQLNLTTDQESLDYLHANYAPLATDEEFRPVGELYTSDPAEGSPFDTGDEHQLSPQYKRLAAVQGDLVFQAPRRFFLQAAAKTQDTWAFLSKRGKNTPFLESLGASHGSDIPEFYGTPTSAGPPTFQGTDALINFANTLDPNLGSGHLPVAWLRYSTNTSAPPLLTFLEQDKLEIMFDSNRTAGMDILTSLSRRFP